MAEHTEVTMLRVELSGVRENVLCRVLEGGGALHWIGMELHADFAKRIVACVNACAGVENPQTVREVYDKFVPKAFEITTNLAGERNQLYDELLDLVQRLERTTARIDLSSAKALLARVQP